MIRPLIMPNGADPADSSPNDAPTDRAEQEALIAGSARPGKWTGLQAPDGDASPGAVSATATERSGDATRTTSGAFTQGAAVGVPVSSQTIGLAGAGSADGGALGTTAVSGPDMTFEISWDSSVSSAPAAFETDVLSAFQFYANLFTNKVTLYFNVGYGEFDGTPLSGGDLGENEEFFGPTQTYAGLRSQMIADAQSPTQQAAVATLPAADPTGGKTLQMTVAEEQALGFTNLGVAGTSFANPDGDVGFSSTANFTYSLTATPASNQYYFLGVAEHEISEVMGRISRLGDDGVPDSDYSPMDLFRYSALGTRQLTTGSLSYFSFNNGLTNLNNWNNFTTGNTGDLGDWAPSAGDDSYLDNSTAGAINPVTPTDISLMNVIGWDTASGGLSPPSVAVNVQNVSVGENASIAAASLITSLTSPNGDSITQYVFEDEGSGNGHFAVSGTVQADDQLIYVPAANLSSVQYIGGSSPGSEPLAVAAYDATTAGYSDFSSLTATTTASPPPPPPPPLPSPPPPPPALTAAQINTVYSDVLGRPASAAEQAAWVAAESSGPLSAAQVIADIVNSPEAVDYSWLIVRLYQAAFDRVPDSQAGFAANVDAVDPASGGKISLLQLAADYTASQEFINDYGNLVGQTTASDPSGMAVFIQALYHNVLGRTGSMTEVNAWLATGDTAAQILIGFSNSAEFQADANPAVARLLTINALAETITTGSLFQPAITGTASAETQTANLALLGQYAAAGFATAPGQGQGTLVTPTAQTDAPGSTLLTTPQH